MQELEEQYEKFLQGKKIPILILDNKWHQIFQIEKKTPQIKALEKELNKMMQRQGSILNEVKAMKKLKATLMKDIVDNMEAAETENKKLIKKQEKNHKAILELNDRLEKHEDEIFELPRAIDQVNRQLMVESMSCCYRRMKINDEKIQELDEWITTIREKLKENVIQKKEMETYNDVIYTYMHNTVGSSITDVFDVKYRGSAE